MAGVKLSDAAQSPTSSPGYAAPLVNQHALFAQPVTSLDEASQASVCKTAWTWTPTSVVAVEMEHGQGAVEAASSVKLSTVYLASSQLAGT